MATFTFSSCDTQYLTPEGGTKLQLFGTFPLTVPFQMAVGGSTVSFTGYSYLANNVITMATPLPAVGCTLYGSTITTPTVVTSSVASQVASSVIVSGSTSIYSGVPTNAVVGQRITGTGIPASTYLISVGTGTAVMSAAATASTGSASLTYAASITTAAPTPVTGSTLTTYVALSPSDMLCYSGVRGQGYVAYPLQTGLVVAFSPVLAPTLTSANLFMSSGANYYFGTNQFIVRPNEFFSSVYALRAILPPIWAVGPRNIGVEIPA